MALSREADKTRLKELATLIREYLLIQKRISQVESWLEAVGGDGRVHGRVITCGAVTGRMTHMSPNMAQVPNSDAPYGPECRQCWTAEEGWSLLGADASGLELRMLAHYLGSEEYVKTVAFGDVHTANQKAAGLETRNQAKTFIYAYLYGAGDEKIGSIVGGSREEGKDLKEKFLKRTPGMTELKRLLKGSVNRGFCKGLDGRNIWLASEHSSLNYLLQGAGAIVMKKALAIFYNKVKANEWPVRLVANVHDEWQMEVRPGYEDIVGKAAVESIKEAGEHFKLRCPLAGEYKYGKTWKDTH